MFIVKVIAQWYTFFQDPITYRAIPKQPDTDFFYVQPGTGEIYLSKSLAGQQLSSFQVRIILLYFAVYM